MHKIVVIGSHAANIEIPDFRENPKDLDIICSYEAFNGIIQRTKRSGVKILSCYPSDGGKKWILKTPEDIVEAEITWPGSSAEKLFNLVVEDKDTFSITEDHDNVGVYGQMQLLYASLNVLYMLKTSHRYLKNSPAFLKTMKDIKLMRKYGASIELDHCAFLLEREKETYNYSHPTLNKKKSEFFSGDGVVYVYDHDSIHQSMKQGEHPAYTYFKDDKSEVMCSEKKFLSCSERVRLNAVLEESLVLALERSQIPFPEMNPNKSFLMALEKVCTSITSGWFREYAWENYHEVKELYEETCKGYVGHFWADIASGIVKKI